jgi:hypothetical protein
VTSNDTGDGDTGANNLQNFPVLTSVEVTSGNTIITGTLDSTPNTTFRLEFFYSSVPDALGYGEGEIFFGSTTTNTDGSGHATFTVTFPTAVPEGNAISSTATDPGDNTSEFSGVYAAPPPTAVVLTAFKAYEQGGQVLVEWETANEMSILGFNLYRTSALDGQLFRLNESLIPARNPGSPIGARYEYLDRSAQPGIAYYWLEDVDTHSVVTRHGPMAVVVSGYRCYLPLVQR